MATREVSRARPARHGAANPRRANGPLDRLADVRASYDKVAERYAQEFGTELDHKPLDRALLAAFADLVKRHGNDGSIGDAGCGPGHVGGYLAGMGLRVVGVDLSPRMVALARSRHPTLRFDVGSLLDLPVSTARWAGAVALYSIIHLGPSDRVLAYRELARAIRSGGQLFLSFHVSTAGQAAGSQEHIDEWWGHDVSLEAYFLAPTEVSTALAKAGFAVTAQLEREPIEDVEYPSRRCYMLAVRQ